MSAFIVTANFGKYLEARLAPTLVPARANSHDARSHPQRI
jgi:hypothetical protein